MKSKTFLLLFMTLLCACDDLTQTKSLPPPPTVKVAIASEQIIYPYLDFIGHAGAGSDAAIEPRITGYLLKDNTRAGAYAKKGEILFTIDKDQFQAKLEQAEGDVLIATANLRNAELELKRQEELFAKKATSRENYENAVYKEIQQQGLLKIQKAKLANAKLELSYTDIRAPFDGKVSFGRSNVGNLVSPGTTLATIVDLNPINIKFNLPEIDIVAPRFSNSNATLDSKLVKSLKVLAFFQNGKEYPIEGYISSFDNRVDRQVGTLLVETKFPNPNDDILPGMYMNVRLQSRNGIKELTIPSRAIRQTQAGAQVFVVNNQDVTEIRYIKTGIEEDQKTQVISGLKAGEKVIIEGISKVRPDEKVIIVQ